MLGAITGDIIGSAMRVSVVGWFFDTLEEAEAVYKEIPRSIAAKVARPFPGIFNKILGAVRTETVYGETCKIVD